MNNKYQRIYDLVIRSNLFVYQEKHNQWIRFIISSVLNNNYEIETIVLAMESLEQDMEPSEVLDILYSTRLDISSILHMIDIIMLYYKNGPKFIRDIYSNYLIGDLELKVQKIEEENKVYQKKELFL